MRKLQTTLNIPLVGSSTFKNNNLFKFISLSGIITFLILFYYIFVKTNSDKKYETGFTFFRSSIKMPGIFNGHHLLFVRTVYRACILKPLEAFLQACSLPPNFQPVIGMHFCKAGFTNSQLVTGQAPSLDEARSFR